MKGEISKYLYTMKSIHNFIENHTNKRKDYDVHGMKELILLKYIDLER